MNSKHQNLERELKELLPNLIIVADLIPIMDDLYKRYKLLGFSEEQISDKINEMILQERSDLKNIIESQY